MPIPWLTEEAVWVPQWPLSSEKLEAAHCLVQEQLQVGHLEPSVSPWNTPIFVIRKKSGSWRLLHDLRAVNAQMRMLGPVQRGLPLLSALPKEWKVLIIDIKDCFFSIPLSSKDRERFAFTLPAINHEQPDARFQWKVLPQGMANSPTICQLYVQRALDPIRKTYPTLKIIHYMDDILLCSPQPAEIEEAYIDLTRSLENWRLNIASEKVQKSSVSKFLGATIYTDVICPQKLEIRHNQLRNLNDFQKLLGDINWLRPYLKIPTTELTPLFKTLEGDPQLTSPRSLTPEALQAIRKVEQALMTAQLNRVQSNEPFELCVLPTPELPTAVLWQHGPLIWIHPQASQARTIEYYPAAVAKLALRGVKTSMTHFGEAPAKIITPYSVEQIQVLCAMNDDWAILAYSFSGTFDNHFPKHPLINFAKNHLLVFPRVTSLTPLPHGKTVYTDGSKTGTGAYVHDGKVVTKGYTPDTPQIVECRIVLEVLQIFPEPLNIVSDSCYVVNAVKSLEVAGLIKASSPVATLFKQIQSALLHRQSPLYITHIRAHSGLPGPMTQGNHLADLATRNIAFPLLDPITTASKFHTQFHVTAETLRKRFSITRAEARNIVLSCQHCCSFLPTPHVGINPRGIRPLQVWQMDVTHISSFGKLKYVHVSVDTCSGVIFASPLSGEKASHVIQHCLEAWSAWGLPQILKTDNGPAYTSTKFAQFCHHMGIKHITGLPYNPQGQGIVERANRTLKSYLLKQKGGIEDIPPTPKTAIALALFTINFLNLDAQGHTAADRHNQWPKDPQELVKWKDVLSNQWKGPDPIIIRSRGAVCVFPQGEENPFWIPERLTRKVLNKGDDFAVPPDPAPDTGDPDSGSIEMGNPVCLS